jgi:hypothetical protein
VDAGEISHEIRVAGSFQGSWEMGRGEGREEGRPEGG